MKQISEKNNIKYGIILSYVNLFVSIVGTLLVTNRMVWYVGDYNYGLYSFVSSITIWLTVVSSALNASFVKFSTVESSSHSGDTSRINTLYIKMFLAMGILILLLGLGVVGGLFFAKVPVGEYDWEDSKYMYYLFAISIVNISLTIPSSLFSLYISYKKKFVFGKCLVIATSIANYVGHFLLAYYFKDVIFIALFSIVITIFNLLMNWFYSKRFLGIKFKKSRLLDDNLLFRSIIVFSGILVLNSIVDQVNSAVDKTLLGFFSTPVDVTAYQLGQNFHVYLVTASVSISGVFIPTIHELMAKKDDAGIKSLYLKVSHAQTIIVCLVAFGFTACGMNFVKWWLGDNYEWVYYVGSILMLIDICPLSLNSSIEIQRSANKHLFRAIVYSVVALLNVGLSIGFMFVFDSKIVACLFGSVIARILSHWILMNAYNKKEFKLPVGTYMLTVLKYAIIGSIGVVVSYTIDKYLTGSIASFFLKTVLQGFAFVLVFLLLASLLDYKFIKAALHKFFGIETNWSNQRKIIKNRRNMRDCNTNNSVPKVIFIVQRTEVFSSVETIMNSFINKGAEVYLLPLPRYNQGEGRFDFESYRKNYDFCSKKTSLSHILEPFDEKTNCFIDVIDDTFDYIFINTSYNIAYPSPFKFEVLSKKSNVCFVPYGGVLIVKNSNIFNIVFNDELLSNVRYIFADNKPSYLFLKKKMKKIEALEKKEIVYHFGFPRFDIVNRERSSVNKTLLWLPRWTTPKEKGNEQSTFLKYYRCIIDYSIQHPEINVIIRPHPIMFEVYVADGFLTNNDVSNMRSEITNLPNVFLDESESYLDSFKKSDILIADFTSLIVEYFASGKPVIFLGDLSNIDSRYKRIVDSFYNLNEWNGIEKCLNELFNGIDDKQDQRLNAINDLQQEFGDGHIGEHIVDELYRFFEKKDA